MYGPCSSIHRRHGLSTYVELVNSPQERDSGCFANTATVNVSRRAGDDTANDEADNDGDVLEERRAEEFGEDDADEGQEAEPDELWGTPGKRARCECCRAELEDTGGRAALAVVRASAPVGNARRADEGSANHDDDRTYEEDGYTDEHTGAEGAYRSP